MSLLTPDTQVCMWTLQHAEPAALATYSANGGYAALKKILAENAMTRAVGRSTRLGLTPRSW